MRLEQAARGWGGQSNHSIPRLSIIVPVHNGAATLSACLKALIEAPGPSREILVSDDASDDGSAEIALSMGVSVLRSDVNLGVGPARNAAVLRAQSPILVFIDCDVVIHADALERIAEFLDGNAGYSAIFGSYDATPGAKGFVSQYRNLLHHFTHQHGKFEAETLWTGLGAVRRSAFEHVGGFSQDRTTLEDVELGLRLSSNGFRIALDRSIQGTHLKAWTLPTMVKTDIFYRALPWSTLILEQGRLTNDLNTNGNGRLGVASVFLATMSLLLAPVWPGLGLVAIAALILMLASIRPLLRHLRRERGLWFALRSIPVHFVHLLCANAGFLMALVRHVAAGGAPSRRLPAHHSEAKVASLAAADG
jgi:cellulose synthase/poly-beta-1,6-N-acetylglucosamine synthase-like glycosyltransferase